MKIKNAKALFSIMAFILTISAVSLWFRFSANTKNNEQISENIISPSNSFYIPNSEYEKIKEKAKNGDVGAIRQMWLYHSIYREDDLVGFEWLVMLANAGEIDAQTLVIDKLSNTQSESDLVKLNELQKKWNHKQPVSMDSP